MIFFTYAVNEPPGYLRKLMLVMKLTTVLLIAAMMQVSAAGYAQKVTLRRTNASLENIFSAIRQQTGYDFLGDATLIRQALPVSLNVRKADLATVLDKCFEGQDLTYTIEEKTVIVKKKDAGLLDRLKTALDISFSVSGTVTDSLDNPLYGANIRVKGSNQVATSDASGRFFLDGLYEKDILVVSFIGYQTQETRAARELKIVLMPGTSHLDEVVIIPYGTTTQRTSTGNITSVSAKEIAEQPVSNPLAALEGRIPGVEITQTSGVPGSTFTVQVRGQTTLDNGLSKSDPLIVIDGVYFEPGNQPSNQLRSAANNEFGQNGLSPLNSIDPNDIESIEVLKDADATAIYGSRGANGVILITTKKGKPGKTVVNASLYTGVSMAPGSFNMMNTQQYVQMRKQAFANDGVTPSSNPNDEGFAPDIMLWDTTRYTNFKKLLIGNAASSTDAEASVSGGDAATQFLVGAGYHRETNVFSSQLADARPSLHFNLGHTSADKKFTLAFSGGYSSDRNELIATDLTQYINLPPNVLLKDPAGNLVFQQAGVDYATVGYGDVVNPLALLLQTNTSVTDNLYSNLQLSYKLLPQLSAKISLSYNDFRVDETALVPGTSIDPYVASYTLPSSSFANTYTGSWTAEPQLNYNRHIGKGALSVLLGGTLESRTYKTETIRATNFSNDLLLNNPAAAGTTTADIEQSLYRYEAVFSRLNYNWEGRYILDATFRRDGSSRFGPDKEFANFGALGGAWIFSDAAFSKQYLPALSFGKLRASYGITGNDQIGEYNYLSLYQDYQETYLGQPALSPAKLYNPDFRWQTNKKLELALELGWLKDRIFLSASYYRERSSNQLVNYPLPIQTGFGSVVYNLPALIQNTGLEILLTTKNIVAKSFSWTTALNMTVPSNKLLAFPGLATSSYAGLYVVGQPVTVINRLKYTGVDPQTGLYTFQDLNHDGQLTSADYQVEGNRGPKYYGGLTNSFQVGRFGLDFLLEFKKQTGYNYLNQSYYTMPGNVYNQPQLVLSRWQQPGDMTNIQRYTAGFSQDAIMAANVYLPESNGIYGDASYIRLKNMSLSYALGATALKRLGISQGRIYVNAQNLLTITRYKGLDPENQDFYVLPPLRTIAAGFQASF
jgi:TonB-linked SusC/RagA family outer membrane protein